MVAKIVKRCDTYQRNKPYNRGIITETRATVPDGPGELVSIDFIKPLSVRRGGVRYILSTVDAFPKFVALYAIRRADTRTTLRKMLSEYCQQMGTSRKIQTDHGTIYEIPAGPPSIDPRIQHVIRRGSHNGEILGPI